MRYFLILLLALSALVSGAQKGHYFLSHYAPGDERINHVAFDIAQDQRGIMYFATRSGILQFDGKSWDLVHGKGAVYALEVTATGEIFWAGAKGFGKLVEDGDGRKEAAVLSDSGREDFYNALAINEFIYFLNDDGIFTYGRGDAITHVPVKQAGSFTSLFDYFGTLHASTDGSGIFKLDRSMFAQTTLYGQGDLDIVFSSKLENLYLLGTADNRLFICSEGIDMQEIKITERDYVNASVIVSGVWISPQLIALGTLRGGVVFINPETGDTEEIINYNTGLPDNEIYSLTTDGSGNIWVSHDYGLTRIAPLLPFRSFSRYDGLKGNLLCVLSFNNDVYAGTSLGLFKLVREEIYEELVYYVDAQMEQPPERPQVPITGTVATEKEKKRGFFRFLKRNRDKLEELGKIPNQTELPSDSEPQLKEQYGRGKVRKSKKILRTTHYVFHKVNGIDAKVTHLVEAGGQLMASGLAGLFQVEDVNAMSILEEPVRSVFTIGGNKLLISTYSDKVLSMKYEGKKWVKSFFPENMDDPISFVFRGHDSEMWLCALDRIYEAEVNDDGIHHIQTVEFPNANFSKIVGIKYGGEVLFANSDGFFRFDRSRNVIVKIDSLPAPGKYFASAGNLWYRDMRSWNLIGPDKPINNLHFLNILNDVRLIASGDAADHIWVITGSNELYRFYADWPTLPEMQFPLFTKSVKQGEKAFPLSRRLRIDQEDGLLTFEVVKPDYNGGPLTEYRYHVRGLQDEWSEWSTIHDRINFSYLPQGNYAIMVQSRDIFGNISDMAPVSFMMRPPYWKTPWFYAMQFTVFVLLVFLSFKVSVKYRIISRLLLLLTIILLIELVQTIAGYSLSTESSPVIDFMIQVIVALIILPMEGFLRKHILSSMGSGSRLYEVISELDRQKKIRK